MSSLARKWRPRTFSELVGQDNATSALANALNQNRLHSAYLFTGTRGVGKTSIARLIAKSLNCEQGISATPCLSCDNCMAIESGHSIDLIEIDGASNTKVEDTRDLLSNVQYLPTTGRYKIYLIDEVHMLSQHSFNALLKTLEEPPAHVIFLLATTDPQKLPITVLSRCIQFHLKHLSESVITQQLIHILTHETIAFEKEALQLIAKAAKGSMRDALSLLDQIIISNSNHITLINTKDCLGFSQQDFAIQLLTAIANNEPQTLLNITKSVAIEGSHFHYVTDELLAYFHQLAMAKLIGPTKIQELPSALSSLSDYFSAEDLQLFYQIALKGREELTLAPTMVIGFEMMLLRMMIFKPAPLPATPPLQHEQRSAARVYTEQTPSSILPPTEQIVQITQPVTLHDDKTPSPRIAQTSTSDEWDNLVPALKLTGIAHNAMNNATLIERIHNQFNLGVAKGHLSLFTPNTVTRIEQALSQYFKIACKIKLIEKEAMGSTPAQKKQQYQATQADNAHNALVTDPFFQQLQAEFSAELITSSIAPSKDGV